jgi:glycine/D-amino acid oxidase-like deaminating enzyme
MKQQQTVLVIDQGLTNTSSRVAAGMYTPISGKRMVKSWMVDELYPTMQQTYTELETLLGETFLTNQHIQLSFASIKEQNDFYSALTDKIEPYVEQNITPNPGLHAPYGAVEIKQSGWLNTVKFLDSFRTYLQKNNSFWLHEFEEQQLIYKDTNWHYGEHTFDAVVFCQGYRNKYNSLFAHIPVIDNKGDVFRINTDALDQHKIYKRGCYAVNLHNKEYKVGSTYKWDNDNTTPTQEGFEELKTKTDALINGSFEVLEHYVGIRPTTKDRRPILGKHHQYNNLFLFNGLGTKGVLVAPYFSKIMADFILHDIPLDPAISTNRFLPK